MDEKTAQFTDLHSKNIDCMHTKK